MKNENLYNIEMTLILDGKKLASLSEEEFKIRVSELKEKTGATPILATILVGNDPASATYVKMKGNACNRIGMDSLKVEMDESTTTEEFLAKIYELNRNENIHGILLQHPVPSQIDERVCFDAIAVEKDVDGVTSESFGLMTMGSDAYGSCTPYGIIRILKHYDIDWSGKSACVIGRSPILGKPMSMMLLNENATVSICHSKTTNLSEIVGDSDIVVAALGKKEFIKSSWLKKGCVLIDAGFHPGGYGDVEQDGLDSICSAYTPVPGGVGPMTINTLIMQTLESCEAKFK